MESRPAPRRLSTTHSCCRWWIRRVARAAVGPVYFLDAPLIRTSAQRRTNRGSLKVRKPIIVLGRPERVLRRENVPCSTHPFVSGGYSKNHTGWPISLITDRSLRSAVINRWRHYLSSLGKSAIK